MDSAGGNGGKKIVSFLLGFLLGAGAGLAALVLLAVAAIAGRVGRDQENHHQFRRFCYDLAAVENHEQFPRF